MKLARHHFNTAIYLGVSLLCKGVSVLLMPLYTSRLDRATYGTYGLCQTFTWIVPPAATLAISAALARFYFDDIDPEKRARTTGTLAGSIAMLSIGFALVAELVVDLVPHLAIADLTKTQMRLVIWICAFIPIGDINTIYLRAAERAGRFAVSQLLTFFTTLGATLVLMLRYRLGLTGLLGGMLAGQTVAVLWTVAITVLELEPRIDLPLTLQAARFSVPFIPHLIGNSLMVGTDRWVLEHFHFKDELGLYTLATQLTLPITLAMSAWNDASSPSLFAAWRDRGYAGAKRAIPRMTLGFALTGIGALIAIFAGMPVLKLFVSDKFRAAFPLVPFVGVVVLTGAFYAAFVNVFQLVKKTRIVPMLTGASVVVNLALNLVLVPRYGLTGAILATGIAYLFRNLIMFAFSLRALKQAAAERPA